ncbi:MAG: cobalt-precorrin 5A hydrolase [Peptococcaceae bacterium]|nr:cobalt-precorrin 5A hydrolase [Peptococcaceae bacterium]
MNIAIVALTEGGAALAKILTQRLPINMQRERAGAFCPTASSEIKVFLPGKLSEDKTWADPYSCSTTALLQQLFLRSDAIICIMASGIVVRALAPVLVDKTQDPAVVVMDEKGQFAISLLSGHLGGANDLARAVARASAGTPVITTATDVQGRLAVDVLAADLGTKLEPCDKIVQVNAAIARGQAVTLVSEYPVPLGKDHPIWRDGAWQVVVAREDFWTQAEHAAQQKIPPVLLTSHCGRDGFLYLRPPTIAVGVGCRKGCEGARVLEAILAACAASGRSPLSIKVISSIEAKAHEAGIHWAAGKLGIPTQFVTAEVLQTVIDTYPGLTQSEFVKNQMGVGGVCEPASLAAVGQGNLILRKQARQGVTVALSEAKFGW